MDEFGRIISYSPPIVENIFKYLTVRQLNTCAQVCSTWNVLAQEEKRRRKEIAWFFQSTTCPIHDTIHTTLKECSFVGVGHPWDSCTDMKEPLKNQLYEVSSSPQLCIAFASSLFFNSFETFFPDFIYSSMFSAVKRKVNYALGRNSYMHEVVETSLRRFLPKHCDLTFGVGTGIIGCTPDITPLDIDEGPAITGLLFPQLPGVEICHFPLDTATRNLPQFIPDKKTIKCLLVFQSHETAITSDVINYCLVKENAHLALGGGIMEHCHPARGSAIAFSGPNVKAASVIIDPLVSDEEKIRRLELFKYSGLLENRCFAFMFCGVAYSNFIPRSALFRSMYPGIPLFGACGIGEIGIDYFPHLQTKCKILHFGKYRRCCNRWLHGRAAVFVLISFKV